MSFFKAAVWLSILGALSMGSAHSADVVIHEVCLEMAQHALAEGRKDSALRCLDFALAINPKNRECLLLKAKLGKDIEVQTSQSADLTACCETMRSYAMSASNLLIRAMALHLVLEFREENMPASVSLMQCQNEGIPLTFESSLQDFKRGKQVLLPKRKPLDPKGSEMVAGKAYECFQDENARDKSTKLVIAALGMDPDCELALRVQAHLVRGTKWAGLPPDALSDDIVMGYLLKKAGGQKKAPLKQKLYVRSAEAVSPSHDDVLLEVSELESKGSFESLEALVKSVAGVEVAHETTPKASSPGKESGESEKVPGKKSHFKKTLSKNGVTELVLPPCLGLRELVSRVDYLVLDDAGLWVKGLSKILTASRFENMPTCKKYEVAISFKIDKATVDIADAAPGFGMMFSTRKSLDDVSDVEYMVTLSNMKGKIHMNLFKSVAKHMSWVKQVALKSSFDFMERHQILVKIDNFKMAVCIDGEQSFTAEIESLSDGMFGHFVDHCECRVFSATITAKD